MIVDLGKQLLQTGAPYLNARGESKKWGVICFTERYDNMAMWANYADQGKGVALEYDLRDLDVPDGALQKVLYQDASGGVSLENVLDPANAGQFSKVLSCKRREWAYEEEWRLLADQVGRVRLSIPLRRVITGVSASNETKTRVAQAVLRNGKARFAELGLAPGEERRPRLHDLLESC
jgi:hypothetical protein